MDREQEAEAYLEKIGRSGSILGLASIKGLMEELGGVQDELAVVHVAGTNGKGSVCAMIGSVLKKAGYRVGKYTSPAVFDRREQYQVDGEWIAPEELAGLIGTVKEACERLLRKGKSQPTVFEVETAAAFLHFYRKKCDVVLLETGLGGAGDATNIIRKPLVSVITSISRDHMGILGETLEEIARAKVGIIKPRGQVVAALPKEAEVRRVLEETCARQEAELTFADEEDARGVCMEWEAGMPKLCFSYGDLGKIRLSMLGSWQVQNAACAIETLRCLGRHGFAASESQIKEGLEEAQWEGRFFVLSKDPFFVIDGAHNEDAAEKLKKTLKMGFTNRRIIYIIGMLADKEHEKILRIMLPLAWKAYTVTPPVPRALDGRTLAEEARAFHEDVTFCGTAKEAVARALQAAREEEAMILAFGSLSYLGEVKKALKGEDTA